MWKGNRNTTTLLFSLKGLEILNQERRGQVNAIVMDHFKIFLFHKSGAANKQHTYKKKYMYIFISRKNKVKRTP
jgi:hypothetical protein